MCALHRRTRRQSQDLCIVEDTDMPAAAIGGVRQQILIPMQSGNLSDL